MHFVEFAECSAELPERIFCYDVATCDVEELEKGGECLDNVGGDESLDCVHINLLFEICQQRPGIFRALNLTYLHESF